ncbi:hypothetical protein CAPTEDRAFT_222897 [Capitella teleta]|uniref:TNFR-Cys domain-containing protein n=1 Tax=Capitella teleta TaxID=283909 RepID=R7T7H4_CAPTE|nr:hypothetical protein CAPTEDRAFT_222897 [Capitella teleta]|eukprot:ELT89373.1 hypothetical protein CAPTEDRAFT_222897 [Capitella teleta]
MAVVFTMAGPQVRAGGQQTVCLAGQYFASGQCQPCPVGTYQSRPGRATSCAQCRTHCVDRRATVLSECDVVSDLRCECPTGYFSLTPFDLCTSHSLCSPGWGVERLGGIYFTFTHDTVKFKICRSLGTTFSDVLCSECPDGYESSTYSSVDTCSQSKHVMTTTTTTTDHKITNKAALSNFGPPPSIGTIDSTSTHGEIHDEEIQQQCLADRWWFWLAMAAIFFFVFFVVFTFAKWKISKRNKDLSLLFGSKADNSLSGVGKLPRPRARSRITEITAITEDDVSKRRWFGRISDCWEGSHGVLREGEQHLTTICAAKYCCNTLQCCDIHCELDTCTSASDRP